MKLLGVDASGKPRWSENEPVAAPAVSDAPASPPAAPRTMYDEMMMTNRQAAEAYEASLPDPPPLTAETRKAIKAIRWRTHAKFLGAAVAVLWLKPPFVFGVLFFWALFTYKSRKHLS
jgi:hypothetical protein